MTNNLRYRYSDFTKLTMSEKLSVYLQKFIDKFNTKPDKIYLNGVYEPEIGNSFSSLPVEYLSTLNLVDIDFVIPEN